MEEVERPPLPPFSLETATEKVRLAEDAWNSRNPERVALAYTMDSQWRNRAEFLNDRADIVNFGHFAKIALRCALPMSGTTTAAIGFAVTVMRTGNSTGMV
jgi:hypothetical protein